MAKKKSVKGRSHKRLSAADRTRILAEAKTNGWTADQVAKKYGVSKWTVYGWRQGTSKANGATSRKAAGRARSGRGTSRNGSLAEILRPLIAEIVREELGRLAGVR